MKRLENKLRKIVDLAKQASYGLALVDTATKNKVLIQMAEALLKERRKIILANKKDLRAASRKRLSKAFIDRLLITDKRIQEMSASLIEISKLENPIDTVIKSWEQSSGLKIYKVRVPIGVILIIYESRPNVTSDCIGLCFKSSNCVILRGGSDAINSNKAIFDILNKAALKNKIPRGSFIFIDSKDRKTVDALLKFDDLIDLVM
ncbi:MAG: aldehyde dehydrogenase family protein, partial [Candidatus Omnitrophica bacterium]|nr:aldehyde dehydrogenase family protein [Candidatus Omnitrophota bacterium]